MEIGGSPKRRGHFYIDETCIGCGACEHACPGKVDAIYAVTEDFLGRFAIVLEACIDCGFCLPLCPVDCIHDARTAGIVEGSGGYTKIKELQSWARERRSSETAEVESESSAPDVASLVTKRVYK